VYGRQVSDMKRDMSTMRHEVESVHHFKEDIDDLRDCMDKLQEQNRRRKLRLLEQVLDCTLYSVFKKSAVANFQIEDLQQYNSIIK
jgi:septal ring factor EnvC (AmiA/AmiB activator)